MKSLARTLALLAVLCLSAAAAANEALWAELKKGGHVVLIRHTLTTAGVGDPPGMRLDDCSTQRNLSDEGRSHAQRIGAAWRTRGLSLQRVVSSPWCRCLETARLAFGKVDDTATALSNLFGRSEKRDAQLRDLRPLVGSYRGQGNLVLVSHGSTILALTGISPATGEMVVVAPRGGEKFEVIGRLAVD
ncbi:MAG TPA: histidine phosphatase family protein [Burkholderiaceae bacterium]|nr:histidine phosphatase family protein [Burkholderiaceae bacterium]